MVCDAGPGNATRANQAGRGTVRTTLSIAVATGLLTAGVALAQDKQDIAWGGSNPGGVMYYMVGVAGTEISNQFPDINVTQVTTGGATQKTKRAVKGGSRKGVR